MLIAKAQCEASCVWLGRTPTFVGALSLASPCCDCTSTILLLSYSWQSRLAWQVGAYNLTSSRYSISIHAAVMDGLSSVASVTAVVSLAIQLADSIVKLHEFWESVQEAPEDVQNMCAELGVLSSVLSEIAIEAQHQPPHDTLITVLKQCSVKIRALTVQINEIEPGFASKSRRIRKWSAIRTVFKQKKFKKLHTALEGLKSTLILAQHNSSR